RGATVGPGPPGRTDADGHPGSRRGPRSGTKDRPTPHGRPCPGQSPGDQRRHERAQQGQRRGAPTVQRGWGRPLHPAFSGGDRPLLRRPGTGGARVGVGDSVEVRKNRVRCSAGGGRLRRGRPQTLTTTSPETPAESSEEGGSSSGPLSTSAPRRVLWGSADQGLPGDRTGRTV